MKPSGCHDAFSWARLLALLSAFAGPSLGLAIAADQFREAIEELAGGSTLDPPLAPGEQCPEPTGAIALSSPDLDVGRTIVTAPCSLAILSCSQTGASLATVLEPMGGPVRGYAHSLPIRTRHLRF